MSRPAADDRTLPGRSREWTTRPEFSSPLVDHLPKVAGVPSPKDVLGHHIGEPKKLTYYADILEVLPRALAAASPRVKVDPHRQEQRGPRPRRRLRRRRRVDREPGDVSRATSRSSPTRARSATRRPKEIIAKAKPIYHLSGRPPQRRSRTVRDADGAGLSRSRRRTRRSISADPRQRHRLDHAGRRSRRPRSQRRLVLPATASTKPKAARPAPACRAGASTIFHDDNRDINYSQVEMRALLELVPAVAPADHARPASGADAALHLQRPGAAESEPRIRSSTASCR